MAEVTIVEDIDRASPDFEALLTREGKTVEEFDRVLLAQIRSFVGRFRDRLATVLIRLEGQQVYVTLGLRADPFDFELCDAESDLLLELCHTYQWNAVQMLQWPGNPDLETLRYASSNAAGESRDGG